MRQSYRIIPIYTADVSGVCSALYELEGMTVIHDPSGCNSTYNTHDEIRWYEEDSLIFISGLTDIDAVMGNDEGLMRDIREAAHELKPKFISLVSSPIPYMNGTDFKGIAEELEGELEIPVFAVPTSGMHDYVYGAGLALAEIGKRFTGTAKKPSPGKHRLNLLGVTPLDFGPRAGAEQMKKNLEAYGWEVCSTWAMGSSLADLEKAGGAEINLVVSSVGIPAANILREKFGTPFLVGTPLWGYEEEIAKKLSETVESTGENLIHTKKSVWHVDPEQAVYLGDRTAGISPSPENAGSKTVIIGEPVTMGSLAAAIEKKYKKRVSILCPLEITEGLLGEHDRKVTGEEEMESALKNAQTIIADPLYRPICPDKAQFFELPHIAFSGRIYLKKIKEMQKKEIRIK